MKPKNTPKSLLERIPCPPNEFAGRRNEKQNVIEIFKQTKSSGKTILISGRRGSGKSSFLNWIEYRSRKRLKYFTIIKEFFETPGTIFPIYEDIITELKGATKYGWFKKTLNNPKVKAAIDLILPMIKVSPIPYKEIIEKTIDKLKYQPSFEYNTLFTSFLTIFNILNKELTEKDKCFVILLDNANWASEAGLKFLKDLIRNIPSRIVLVLTFRLEGDNMKRYDELINEINWCGQSEISLGGMDIEGIKDLASIRYHIKVGDEEATFLKQKVGDPYSLISFFNLLVQKKMDVNIPSFNKILSQPEALKLAQCVYRDLGLDWQKRMDCICILFSPIKLSLIACILSVDIKEISQLKTEIERSHIFKELTKEEYDFAHPSLREYCRDRLTKTQREYLHLHAAKCRTSLKKEYSDQISATFSLAMHFYLGKDYQKALSFNLESSKTLYNFFDFNLALKFTEQAKICAEKVNNKDELAHAYHQKGTLLLHLFKFSESKIAYNQSLKIRKAIDNRAGEASILHQIGIVYQETNHFKKALDYYNQSLKIERAIGDRAGEAKSLH